MGIRKVQKNSDVFNNQVINTDPMKSPTNKPTWKRRKDLFVEITALQDSRKSTPDRFIPYKVSSSLVDNSPGLILSDGEKLPDI